MAKKNKRKSIKENLKICTDCFGSKHIVFSFAYLTNARELSIKEVNDFWNRMLEVTSVPFVKLMEWGKVKGFEDAKLEITKEIPKQFEEEIRKFDGKYTVIRLYKNNVPTPGRIIGKLVNKVFYIFYIDVKGELYKH